MNYLKVSVALVGAILLFTNVFNIVGSGRDCFLWVICWDTPIINYPAIFTSLVGIALMWFAVYRIHPKGSILGSEIED